MVPDRSDRRLAGARRPSGCAPRGALALR